MNFMLNEGTFNILGHIKYIIKVNFTCFWFSHVATENLKSYMWFKCTAHAILLLYNSGINGAWAQTKLHPFKNIWNRCKI